jgi:hypothetical protein
MGVRGCAFILQEERSAGPYCTAEKIATQRAETAVVAALTPICVEDSSSKPMSQQSIVAFNKAPSWAGAQ